MPTGKKLREIDNKGRGGSRIVHVSKKIDSFLFKLLF